jgi:hypothetical protein
MSREPTYCQREHNEIERTRERVLNVTHAPDVEVS